jgi:hypothetical protein
MTEYDDNYSLFSLGNTGKISPLDDSRPNFHLNNQGANPQKASKFSKM